MKLYHYGFDKSILEEGLEPMIKHEDTMTINNLIYDEFGSYYNRHFCVFFNLDKRDIGDITVSVDLKDLDQDLLYIADQNIADDMYRNWYRGNDCKELVKSYVNSIKKFSEYNNEYLNSEVFYAEYVSPEMLTIESMEE